MIEIDEIIRSKRKTVAIQITNEGKVIIRAGLKTPETFIRKIVNERQNWIIEKRDQALKNHNNFKKRELCEGAEYLLLGNVYHLKIKNFEKSIHISESDLIIPNIDVEKQKQKLIMFYKDFAYRYFYERINKLCELYNFSYDKLRITSAYSRWGSCSSNKTISFTWRLIMAPEAMIDYVIIHELCHTKHMDHSKLFWDSVEKIIPDYKVKKKWFSEHSSLLRREFFE